MVANSIKEFEKTDKLPFGGASGAGVSLKPVAFRNKGDSVRLLSVDHENTCDRIIDSVPQIIDLLKGTNKNKKEENSNVSRDFRYNIRYNLIVLPKKHYYASSLLSLSLCYRQNNKHLLNIVRRCLCNSSNLIQSLTCQLVTICSCLFLDFPMILI